MPRALNESENLDFWRDFGGQLNIPLSPSGGGGAVVIWEMDPQLGHGIPVLVYHNSTDGLDYASDISDLPPAAIAALGLPALAHGQLYFLPDAIVAAIGAAPQNIANAAQWVAQQIGKVAGAGLQGAGLGIDLTTVAIAAVVILALMYLPRSSRSS